jgi:hypothetical protein
MAGFLLNRGIFRIIKSSKMEWVGLVVQIEGENLGLDARTILKWILGK